MVNLRLRLLILAVSLSFFAPNTSADPWIWLRVPHFAVGGGYTSYLTISGSPVTASRSVYVYLYDNNGQALTVNVDGVAQSSFNFAISPTQERSFALTGLVPSRLDVGSIQIAAWGINNINASVRFGSLDGAGNLSDVVGILPVEPNFNWTLSAERRTGLDNTGVAVANPWANSGATTVVFDLYQGGNRVPGTSPVTRAIAPLGHLSLFVSELFPGVSYSGVATLRISSTQSPFVAVALRADSAEFSSLPTDAGIQTWSVTYTGQTGAVGWSWRSIDGYTFLGNEQNPETPNSPVRLRGVVASDLTPQFFLGEWNYISTDGTQGVMLYIGVPSTESGIAVVNGIRYQMKSDGTIVNSVTFKATRTY